ncbi:hypothetical protein [Geomicrobium sp. JCM 19039]|uniref:hypothetical protein n=1 Tax=Geomicrobium sp. JCM 19039 TaxID=1460636 RepID=UPI00045F1595|nr:hypothetical protein [Geomicrobium sp. JCM 19039]GAK12200.1 hypothetical protein JCM19039_1944 [Geomicrobium sp. JCM 19039]
MRVWMIFVSIALLMGCGAVQGNEGFFENHRDEMIELDVVDEEIGSDFSEVTVENNQGGSRVILYKNDGVPQYKSVFIKNDQRLKIIATTDDGEDRGLLFEDVLER